MSNAVDPPPPPRSPFRFSVIPQQWKLSLPDGEELEVPRPVTRDGETQRVTLEEAIGVALENNPGSPRSASSRCVSTRTCYRPSHSTTPSRAAAGSTPTPSRPTRTRWPERGPRSSTPACSTPTWGSSSGRGRACRWRSTGTSSPTTGDSSSSGPQYTPTTGFSLFQPLLRDFGWDFSYLIVRVAERTAEGALYQYEAQPRGLRPRGDRCVLQR